MVEAHDDNNRNARFLDGRMEPREREGMVRHLTQDARERDAVAVTAELLAEVDAEDAAAPAPGAVGS